MLLCFELQLLLRVKHLVTAWVTWGCPSLSLWPLYLLPPMGKTKPSRKIMAVCVTVVQFTFFNAYLFLSIKNDMNLKFWK